MAGDNGLVLSFRGGNVVTPMEFPSELYSRTKGVGNGISFSRIVSHAFFLINSLGPVFTHAH